jgi:hypothetical protein
LAKPHQIPLIVAGKQGQMASQEQRLDWYANPQALVGKRISVLWAQGKRYSG